MSTQELTALQPGQQSDEASTSHVEQVPVGGIAGAFHVPPYQRGYKWTEPQVTQLLDDVWEHAKDPEKRENPYCLQPIVTKSKAADGHELIDGQQRLTTLYILLRISRSGEPGFAIEYDNRGGSGEYLRNLTSPDASKTRLAESWCKENSDFYHMWEAYQAIIRWQDRNLTDEASERSFGRFLQDRTMILWYHVGSRERPEDLFTRLNSGRIPLTDSELFKAVLLTWCLKNGGESRAYQVAAEWDDIEQRLQDADAWAFVTGEPEPSSTPVDLLLASVTGTASAPKSRLQYDAFHKIAGRIKRGETPEAIWEEVVERFSLIRWWYDDRVIYHRVGFLTAKTGGGRSFGQLVELAANRRKSEFKDVVLKEEIRHAIAGADKGGLDDLSYDEEKGKALLERLLLLFNTETVADMKHSTERYSFAAHAREQWSLEHIQPQDSMRITSRKKRQDWAEAHARVLEELRGLLRDPAQQQECQQHIDWLSSVTDRASDDESGFLGGADAILRFLDQNHALGEPLNSDDMHHLKNLALLTSSHNSSLGDYDFSAKRHKIVEMIENGEFIPVCTREVFLKFYSKKNSYPSWWGQEDADDYYEAMKNRLRPFLRGGEPAHE